LRGAKFDCGDKIIAQQCAQLQGASLALAELQGASLDGAHLQGASLYQAQLEGASLLGVYAWGADARQATWEDTRVPNPKTGPKYDCIKNNEPSTCDWSSPQSFNELKQLIAEQIPEGDMRSYAMKRIEQRLDPSKALMGEDEMAKVWENKARSSPTTQIYEKHLAGFWREIGCAAEGAPYVLRGLFAQLERSGGRVFETPFRTQSPQKLVLAKAFLDEEHCPGARGLTEDEKAKLKEIRDRPPPPAPKK
jgi:hypothetical protein